jgi:hypothetical protein
MYCRGCGCPSQGIDRLLQRLLAEAESEESSLVESLDWDAAECYDWLDDQMLASVRALIGGGELSEIGACVGPALVAGDKIVRTLCYEIDERMNDVFDNHDDNSDDDDDVGVVV